MTSKPTTYWPTFNWLVPAIYYQIRKIYVGNENIIYHIIIIIINSYIIYYSTTYSRTYDFANVKFCCLIIEQVLNH